ncbi:glycerophosphodiester phosphodiesterase [Planctellipticum variicoloris]|uniref:glycerophosphodiester phosphodiesterase n=1 Tax=Planctellipticum variicoloris TaxID=3064265 RepID=UPI0030134BF0|nr:hypothetical protein SH412_004931 [Planctomycetaceae bacterium SH412]
MHRWTFLRAAFILLLIGPVAAAEPPHVVAHRGLRRHAPENTRAAFQSCLTLQFGFEFDVQRSKDGQLICLHDKTLDRTTNGRGPAAAQTLADLQQLDAGRWFDPSFAGEKIPTIAKVLDLVQASSSPTALMAVDLKDAAHEVGAEVVRMAAERKVLDRLLFIGATIQSRELRESLRAASRNTHTARLVEKIEDLPTDLDDATADWMYLRVIPSAADVEKIHARGKRVFVAGANYAGHEEAHWAAVTRAGVDAILTDYPLELRRMLRAK